MCLRCAWNTVTRLSLTRDLEWMQMDSHQTHQGGDVGSTRTMTPQMKTSDDAKSRHSRAGEKEKQHAADLLKSTPRKTESRPVRIIPPTHDIFYGKSPAGGRGPNERKRKGEGGGKSENHRKPPPRNRGKEKGEVFHFRFPARTRGRK